MAKHFATCCATARHVQNAFRETYVYINIYVHIAYVYICMKILTQCIARITRRTGDIRYTFAFFSREIVQRANALRPGAIVVHDR